jgi:hypothetical protein
MTAGPTVGAEESKRTPSNSGLNESLGRENYVVNSDTCPGAKPEYKIRDGVNAFLTASP